MEATTRLLRGRTLRGDSWRPTPCNRAEISTPAGLTISLSWVDGSMDSMVPGFLKLAGQTVRNCNNPSYSLDDEEDGDYC